MERVDYCGTLWRRIDLPDAVSLRFADHAMDLTPGPRNILAITVRMPRIVHGAWNWFDDGGEVVMVEYSGECARIHLTHSDDPWEVEGQVTVGFEPFDADDYLWRIQILQKRCEVAKRRGDEGWSRVSTAIAALDRDEDPARRIAGQAISRQRSEVRYRNLLVKVRRILAGDD